MLLVIALSAQLRKGFLTCAVSCVAGLVLVNCAFLESLPAKAAGFRSAGLQPGTSSFQAPATQTPSPPATLEGKVCNAAGDPLADALVRLEKESSSNPVSARSDAQGRYVFSGLAAGSYRITLEQSDFRPLVLSPVLLKPGEKKHLDAVLEKLSDAINLSSSGSMELSDTAGFTIAGVTDWSNVGLHGSDVNVRTSDSLAKEAASLTSSASDKSSAASRAGDAHRVLADAKEANGDPIGAVNEYEAAAKVDPSEQNYFAWGAELLVHRAGQPAVQVFSNGAKAHPDSSRMLAGLGAAYYSNGQYAQAAAQICRASELDPVAPAPYLFLGQMEKAAADPLPCSESALARFAADQPTNSRANFFYGLVLWKKARKTQDSAGLARAEQLFQKAAQLDPHFAEVYLQLGMLYNARGEKDAAMDAFQKAVAADANSSGAHYQLSLAYRRSANVAKADQEMKTYDELRRTEDAKREEERRDLRQFVTILKKDSSSSHE
jgi:tetratricopeptide (TPR) repeat protein